MIYELTMLANTALWLVLTVLFVRHPGASIFHPLAFYLAFHFIAFVLRPPIAYYRDYDLIYRVYGFQPTLDQKVFALFVAMVGLATFAAISLYRTRSHFEPVPDTEADRAGLGAPFVATALVLTPIALASYIGIWAGDLAGTSTVQLDAATGTSISVDGANGYFYEARAMLGPLSVLFAWLTRFRWWSFIPIALFVLLAAGTGGRGAFVLAIIAMGLIYLYETRRRWPTATMLGAVAVLAAFFTAVGDDRGSSVREWVLGDDANQARVYTRDERFLEGMDAANLEYVEYLVWAVPERSGTYGYFLELLQFFTEPIPRKLWPDKPIGPPVRLFNLFDYGNPIGMTRTLPGQGYVDLGLGGVIVWCGLFALLWSKAYEMFATHRFGPLGRVGYMLMLALSILFYRDGGPLTMARFGLFLLAPVIMIWGIDRIMRSKGLGDTNAARPVSAETPRQRRERLAGEWVRSHRDQPSA